METTKTNNQVTIKGNVLYDFKLDHETRDMKFYKTELEINRFSGVTDRVPLIVSDRLLKDKLPEKVNIKGQSIKVYGYFRSFNYHENNNHHLVLYVYAQDIEVDLSNEEVYENNIHLDGYICKKSLYRETPLGREITDLLIAVNHTCGKSDYIPCVCWGGTARYADTLEVGQHLKLDGRIQSREYQKRLSETEIETRVAYEVSVGKLECVED